MKKSTKSICLIICAAVANLALILFFAGGGKGEQPVAADAPDITSAPSPAAPQPTEPGRKSPRRCMCRRGRFRRG